jgi:hypothetical protein
MTILESSLPLTVPSKVDYSALARDTFPGMAHFAGTGPAGLSCRVCTNWSIGSQDWYASGGKHGGAPKPRGCRAFSKFTMGRDGAKVPHDAKACKHFEQETNPTPLRRPSK